MKEIFNKMENTVWWSYKIFICMVELHLSVTQSVTGYSSNLMGEKCSVHILCGSLPCVTHEMSAHW
jgi:hypothetical protein